MDIRRLTADDWRAWRAMRLELLRDSPDAFGSTYEETLTRTDESFQEHLGSAGDRAVFVAEEGLLWLASAGGHAEPDERGDVWLFTVWTRPEARGRGLQTQLAAAVMDWARGCGYTSMKLWVTETNEPAQACYRQLGFRPTGETQLMRDTIHELLMTRAL